MSPSIILIEGKTYIVGERDEVTLHNVPIDDCIRDHQKRNCYRGGGVAVIGNIARGENTRRLIFLLTSVRTRSNKIVST